MKVTIIGAGYVGLTTGVALAYLGHRVACVDKNEELVARLQSGETVIHEPGLPEMLEAAVGRLSFHFSLEGLVEGADVIVIAVGTPPKANGDADLGFVEEAAREIGKLLQPGSSPVVVNKSTVPIGSARRVRAVIDSCLEKRGVASGYAVASNPEFLREGAALFDTLYPDRIVVGAEEPRAVNVLRELYAPILEQTFSPPRSVPRPEGQALPVLVTTSPTSAELMKYAANSFLAVKISFINEFAGLAEKVGADITEIARGIGLDKRIGSRFLQAGAGWGGSCFGKDTAAVLHTAGEYRYSMPLVDAAIAVNKRQRGAIIDKLQALLKVIRGSTITLLGLAFKPDTDDLRDAPALEVAARLLEMGARVKVYDPVAMENCRRLHPGLEVEYTPAVREAATGADALVLMTEWQQFYRLDLNELGGVMRRRVLVDGRNILDPGQVKAAGFEYAGVGRQ